MNQEPSHTLDHWGTSDLDAPHLSDLGNAKRFVTDHRSSLRYVPAWRTWLVWDGRRWKKDERLEVLRYARQTVQAIYAEAAAADDDAERSALAKHALKSESAGRIAAMVDLAKSECAVVVTPDQLDADRWKLTVLNGTINLQTGDLHPHDREDLISKLAPVVYEPAAECPQWQAFLERISAANRKVIGFVQRAFGSALTGVTKDQVIFIFWGTGANGKTTLITVFMDTLGEYALQTPATTLMVKRGDAIPNDVARLQGARFVAAVEGEEGHHLAEGLVKQMTGGDRLSARFMRAEWFEFRPEFKLFFATNHKPIIRGTDHAIWRRVRIVPFTVSIPDSEQDPALPDKLRAEAPGILRWAVEGCLTWQRDGLGTPDEVLAATDDYRQEMDVLGEFIRECCVVAPDSIVNAGDLYRNYVAWCERTKERPLTQTAFGRRLGERGFRASRDKAKQRTRSGLHLHSVPDTEKRDGFNSGTSRDGFPRFPFSEVPRRGEPENAAPTRHPSPKSTPLQPSPDLDEVAL